jgi:hypothetical protein
LALFSPQICEQYQESLDEPPDLQTAVEGLLQKFEDDSKKNFGE